MAGFSFLEVLSTQGNSLWLLALALPAPFRPGAGPRGWRRCSPRWFFSSPACRTAGSPSAPCAGPGSPAWWAWSWGRSPAAPREWRSWGGGSRRPRSAAGSGRGPRRSWGVAAKGMFEPKGRVFWMALGSLLGNLCILPMGGQQILQDCRFFRNKMWVTKYWIFLDVWLHATAFQRACFELALTLKDLSEIIWTFQCVNPTNKLQVTPTHPHQIFQFLPKMWNFGVTPLLNLVHY